MAKQTSLFGKISGKLGAVVFSTSGGETISREYNPNVANPSTQAQVNQRARMKLMSQLSASLAPVIAYTKDGLVSRRNKFVKSNFAYAYAQNGVAQISYENIQLTEGSIGLPQIVAAVNTDIDTPTGYVGLASAPAQNLSRVVYCVFEKTQENRLSLITSVISSGNPQNFASNVYFGAYIPEMAIGEDQTGGIFTKEYVIYAYGMCDTSERATAQYGNLNVQSASDLATLVANRSISFQDYQFTQTRGTTVGQGSGGDTPTPAGQARVFVTALGNGTVSGGGTFALGSTVTVTATPDSGATFRGWRINGNNAYISTANPYSFELNGQRDLIAVFEGGGNESL